MALELVDFAEEYGEDSDEGDCITDRDYVLSRKGESMNDTKYKAVPKDSSPFTKKHKAAKKEAIKEALLDEAIEIMLSDTDEDE